MHSSTATGNTQRLAPQNANHDFVARNITMSSLEIAELTGKLHKNVIRDIREVLDEVLLNDEFCPSCLQDAKIEALHACLALQVLVCRLCGSEPETLRKATFQRYLEQHTLANDVEQLPAWGTLQ